MPALPDVPNVLKLQWIFQNSATVLSARVRNFWRGIGGPLTSADGVTIANEAMSLAFSHLNGFFPSEWVLEAVEVTDLSSPTGVVATSTHASIPGTSAGDLLPIETAACVTYPLGRRYRGGHPKEFWPFGDDGMVSNQRNWSPTFITNLDTQLADVIAGLVGFVTPSFTINAKVNISYYEGFHVVTGSTGRVRNAALPRSSPLVDVCGPPLTNPAISQQRRRRGKV